MFTCNHSIYSWFKKHNWLWVINCYAILGPCPIPFNTLRLRQKGRHFPDDIFKWIFLNENVWISINISLKFLPRGPINNIPTLVQVLAWRQPGDKPLSGPTMARLQMHICVTRPQWVNCPSNKWCIRNDWHNPILFFTGPSEILLASGKENGVDKYKLLNTCVHFQQHLLRMSFNPSINIP